MQSLICHKNIVFLLIIAFLGLAVNFCLTNTNKMVKSQVYYKAKEFEGMPQLSDFKIVEEEVSEDLEKEEILTEAVAISVDPFIRAYNVSITDPVIGFQTAKVIKSENEKYPVGCHVLQTAGWRTISKTKGDTIWYNVDTLLRPDHPKSYSVGALGMPGITAYAGLLWICEPKAGETVMVNGCAGAVGSLVGQIAKLKGCTVIGCCGTEDKCNWAKSIGFDGVFNYKTDNCKEAIAKLAPKGIDCFFDNVGGQMSSDIINSMNIKGRVAVCGSISSYNDPNPPKADILQPALVSRQLKIEGFNVVQFRDRFAEALKDLAPWVAEGKLKIRETVTEGFENIPKAFIDMLSGGNTGKAVVRISNSTKF